MLNRVLQVMEDLDVTILYYTTIEPFDKETLINNLENNKLFICEPYYEGGILLDCIKSIGDRGTKIEVFGYPHVFCTHYGYTVDNLAYWDRSDKDMRKQIESFICV